MGYEVLYKPVDSRVRNIHVITNVNISCGANIFYDKKSKQMQTIGIITRPTRVSESESEYFVNPRGNDVVTVAPRQ